MHRIDHSTATGSLPAADAPGTPGYFTKGAAGVTPATVLDQDWHNAIQEEPINVILDAGIALVKGTHTQLRDAIRILAARAALSTINYALNPDFKVWQRGITINSTTPAAGSNNDDVYGADQWILLSDGNNVVSLTREATTVPAGSRQALKATVVTANKKFVQLQIREASVSIPLRGKKMSLSIQARRGSSATLTKMRMALISWNGTADAVTSDCVSVWNGEGTNPTLVFSGTGWAYIGTPVALGDLTTSYAAFKIENLTIPNDCNNLGILIWSDDATTTVGDELYLGQVKLELGSVITDFIVASLDAEVRACQRFARKSHKLDTAPVDASGADNYDGAVQGNMALAPNPIDVQVHLDPPMHHDPTVTLQTCRAGEPAANWTRTNDANNFAATVARESTDSFEIGGNANLNGYTWRIHYLALSEL
mgnify:CR=1 FL=1